MKCAFLGSGGSTPNYLDLEAPSTATIPPTRTETSPGAGTVRGGSGVGFGADGIQKFDHHVPTAPATEITV